MNRRHRDRLKVFKILESCTTQEQLNTAYNVLKRYEFIYGEDQDIYGKWIDMKFSLIDDVNIKKLRTEPHYDI